MRRAVEATTSEADSAGKEADLEWHWAPSGGFPGQKLLQKLNSVEKTAQICTLLFGGNTRLVGTEHAVVKKKSFACKVKNFLLLSENHKKIADVQFWMKYALVF